MHQPAARPRAPLRIYEEKLGACVLFGAGNGLTLSFNPVWLDRPNLMCALPQASVHPLPAHGDMQKRGRGDDDLIAAIDHLFTGAALCGTLSLVETARSLGLSPRTLQRRLAAMGASFEMQLDIWRRRQAQRALAGSALPVNTLARTLGYGDAAHFIRAFRRWEGCTPGAFRQRVRAAHEGAMAPMAIERPPLPKLDRALEHAPIGLHRRLIGSRILYQLVRGRFTDQIVSI